MTNSLDPAHELVPHSPPLSLLAGVFATLFVASIAANFLMAG